MTTSLNPSQSNPEQLTQLGLNLVRQEKIDQAIDMFQLSLAKEPSQVLANYFLANCYKIQRKFKEAATFYSKTLEIDPGFHPARWGLCICQICEFYEEEEEIEASRQAYSQQLRQLDEITAKGDPKALGMGAQVIGSFYPFFLPYQGLNDCELQKIHGRIVQRCMSFQYPAWSKPLAMPPLKENERLRVGFVSRYFSNHSVWKIPLRGWLQALNPKHFETFAYLSRGRESDEHKLASQLVDSFTGDLSFEALAEKIKADQLHVLIYPEIGMDPVTTRLASLRLAPIQCTGLGHPETTGLSTIDYFLTSELMEPPEAESHYSESLVKLSNLSVYCTPNQFGSQDKDWASLGIKKDSVKYLCCQSLFKYLPQYDWVWPAIAKRVPHAQFIFINYPDLFGKAMQKRLEKAFEKENLSANDHVVFVPHLLANEWTSLLRLGDVALDSIGWSGFNSSIETLEQHVPIVTCPSSLMRSRHTMAVLKFMQVESTITSSLEAYVDLAVTLGNDPSKRQALKEEIADKIDRLYYDRACIEDLERFLKEKVNSYSNG